MSLWGVQGLSAYVVENPRHVEDALARLKGSMKVGRPAWGAG